MLSYSDYFEDISKGNSYFAGANTGKGFVCDYDGLMSEEDFEKIYIVKGGSGTGKSTLIKKAAEEGKKKNAEITYILCSSDPDSLDGVIIEKRNKKIAVIDGTAPHIKEPEYAGACGEIINCGDHWNASFLENKKDEIASLAQRKSLAYKRAYRYLAAASEIFEIQQSIGAFCLEKEKMKKSIERLVANIGNKNGKGKLIYRRTECISMKGAYRLSSFERCKNQYGVADCCFISPYFLEMLKNELLGKGLDVIVSESPIFGICEICIPSADAAFVPFEKGREYGKCINLKRFANAEKAATVKQRRIFTSKCLFSMVEGALECLRDAGDIHFVLEGIYKGAMDFNGLDKMAEKLKKSIAERL